MSEEHGETSDISGGEDIDVAPGIEPLMEPLQPRRSAAPRPERQTRSHGPLPMLLPAHPVSMAVPDPQTPAPLAEFSVPDPQTPAPFPGLVSTPAVPDRETPPT